MSQKNKKRGKNQKSRDTRQKRELLFAEENQMYASVDKILGNCRVIAKCNDGKSRICHIRGKLKKRVWVREGSVILIGLREFEDDKADIIHCYLPEEIRRLKAYGELPETAGNNGDNDEEIAWQYEGTKNGEENENEEKNENGENKKEEDNDKEGIVEKQDQDIKDL